MLLRLHMWLSYAGGVGWGGVERGGANNVSRHLTCCYACTCG